MTARYKVAELEGALLDAAVAKANTGRNPSWDGDKAPPFSTNWTLAGPIIEREEIGLLPPGHTVHRNGGPNAGWGPSGIWSATSWKLSKQDGRRASAWHGTSGLVAAMRLYVLCKLGDEVEL